jgi:hypothetical protein
MEARSSVPAVRAHLGSEIVFVFALGTFSTTQPRCAAADEERARARAVIRDPTHDWDESLVECSGSRPTAPHGRGVDPVHFDDR